MRDKALAAIARYHMFDKGGQVVVGVSGGADSVALLHFLWVCAGQLGITLTAAHINHGLRGSESDRDEQFVRDLCARLGVPLKTLALKGLADAAKVAGQGLEAHARDARYRFFGQIAQEMQAKIATAHSLDDSVETTLFNLARGTGLRGLRGIPPVRGAIVRPLIRCTRSEIEDYCTKNGLDYVTDSTNLADGYARNRIRHHVVPQLRRAHEGFDAAYARMTEHITLDEDYLQQEAERALAECAIIRGSARNDFETTEQTLPEFPVGVVRGSARNGFEITEQTLPEFPVGVVRGSARNGFEITEQTLPEFPAGVARGSARNDFEITEQTLPEFPAGVARFPADVVRSSVQNDFETTEQTLPEFPAGVARLQVDKLRELHGAVRYRVLALWLAENNLPHDTAKIQLILGHLDNGHFAVELTAGRFVEIAHGELSLHERVKPTPYFELSVCEGTFEVNNAITVTFALTNYEQYKQIEKFDTKGLKNALDYDKIYGNLIFRQKRDGDRIKLSQTGITKSLKKLFNEKKLSAWQRQNTPVLADEHGVVWVSGFGVDERAIADGKTKFFLTVNVAEVDEWRKTF